MTSSHYDHVVTVVTKLLKEATATAVKDGDIAKAKSALFID